MAGGLTVMGIMVDDRAEVSPAVQAVLSDFGAQILVRTGIPSPDRRRGLLTLVLDSDDLAVRDLARRLEAVGGVSVRTMSF